MAIHCLVGASHLVRGQETIDCWGICIYIYIHIDYSIYHMTWCNMVSSHIATGSHPSRLVGDDCSSTKDGDVLRTWPKTGTYLTSV